MERGLARKKEKPLSKIGVDEKAIAKGHQYMTLVCDLLEGTIEYVGEGRKTESLETFYQTLSPEQRNGIRAVSIVCYRFDLAVWWSGKEADSTWVDYWIGQEPEGSSLSADVGMSLP